MAVEGLNASCLHFLGHVLRPRNQMILQTFFVKTNLVQKIALISTYGIIMYLEHFEIKNKVLRSL